MTTAKEAAQDLAPNGLLRVAINTGNPVLVQRRDRAGEPTGPSVDIAREFARRLNVEILFIVYDAAGKVVEAVDRDEWALGFLAIDPLRAEKIAFSPPYVVIEGTYLVRDTSPISTPLDADAPGVRIVVEENAAYDLYLKKSLKHATLVRPSARGGALELLLDQNLEALAGVREGLDQLAKETPGLRVLKDRFMAIEQAIAMPAKYKTGAAYAAELIEELKSSGFIRHTLDLHGQMAAVVAPAKIR